MTENRNDNAAHERETLASVPPLEADADLVFFNKNQADSVQLIDVEGTQLRCIIVFNSLIENI